MFAEIKKLIKDCLTVKNGTDYDNVRVFMAALVVGGMIFGGYDVIENHHIDWQGLSIYFGSVLGVGSAGLNVKNKTEPQGEGQ